MDIWWDLSVHNDVGYLMGIHIVHSACLHKTVSNIKSNSQIDALSWVNPGVVK